MTGVGLGGLLLFAAISLTAASLAVLVTGRLLPPPASRGGQRRGPIVVDMPSVYTFEDGYLQSPIDPNDPFIAPDTDRSQALLALNRSLTSIAPEFETRLETLQLRSESFVLSAGFGADKLSLSGRMDGPLLIVTVGPTDSSTTRESVDSATLGAMRSETEELRVALDTGPTLVWKTASDGQVTWANDPYRAVLEEVGGPPAAQTWPVPKLFALTTDDFQTADTCLREQVDHGDGVSNRWFDITTNPLPDGGTVWVAQCVDALLKVEADRRAAVQTLGSTFAQLPIGLAVFDRDRALIVFNPALVDLLSLNVGFLAGRPSLKAFLDAMRQLGKLPEPRSYRTWRDEISHLEQCAEAGTYQELWSLPGGEAFRVVGRPHPDGGIAFMFEDITSELSLTRKFRGDLDLRNAVIDTCPASIVFGPEGQFLFSNAAYGALWGEAAPGVAEDHGLIGAVAQWRARSAAPEVWSELVERTTAKGQRGPWNAAVTLADGGSIDCVFTPLPGRASLITFAPTNAARPRVNGVRASARPRALAAAEEPGLFVSRRGAGLPSAT